MRAPPTLELSASSQDTQLQVFWNSRRAFVRGGLRGPVVEPPFSEFVKSKKEKKQERNIQSIAVSPTGFRFLLSFGARAAVVELNLSSPYVAQLSAVGWF